MKVEISAKLQNAEVSTFTKGGWECLTQRLINAAQRTLKKVTKAG
jgi:hypothetical protein